jgi:hypothetical protein
MHSSLAEKRDYAINPVAAVAAVLVMFWGAVAGLLWCLL